MGLKVRIPLTGYRRRTMDRRKKEYLALKAA
jgi:hypothetical protein